MLCIFFLSFLLVFYLSSWYGSVKTQFIPLVCLQWWSQPLKILPIPVKGHLLGDTIIDRLLPSSRKQATVISLCLNKHICYGCYRCVSYYRYLCTCSRNQDFMFESPLEVTLPNDYFQGSWVQRRQWRLQRQPGKMEWADLCPPYTHLHPFKQSIDFLSVSHIGVNVYMHPIKRYCLLSPTASPTFCKRREFMDHVSLAAPSSGPWQTYCLLTADPPRDILEGKHYFHVKDMKMEAHLTEVKKSAQVYTASEW